LWLVTYPAANIKCCCTLRTLYQLCPSLLLLVPADNAELECSEGVLPTQTQTLQLPSTAAGKGRLGQTCLVGQTCSTLAASWKGVSPYQQANAVLTFDLQTQRPVNAFMGHLYPITGIAAAPAAWPGSEHLFATVGASRDVKIWDVRCSGGAAAVTLVTGGQWSMSSVVLASNSGGSSGGSSGGGSQLGAGLMCFAGGLCESVWAWDVRASSAQALYQLSTGNQEVSSLAWHEASSSLIACCDAHYDW
jgi:WD40 repeat protein